MSGLGNLPAGLPPGLRDYLESLQTQFETTQADRGSPLSSKPTWQDLIDVGLVAGNVGLRSNGKSFNAGDTSWIQPNLPGWFTSLLAPPSPTGLIVTMDQANIVLYWDQWVSEFYLQTIVYRSTTNDLTSAIQIGSTSGTTYVDNLPPDGQVYYYWIRTQAKNLLLGDYNAVSGTTVGNVAGAPNITASFFSTDLVLNWPTPTSALLIQYYVIRYGSSFEGGIDVGISNTNTLRITVDFGGTRRFWIAPVDINNQVGQAGSVLVTVVPAFAPVITQTVQNDSLVLTASAAPGSLPIQQFEFRYGSSFATAISITKGASNRFDQVVNFTGSRTFWVVAIDTAGNYGTENSVIFDPVLPSTPIVSAQVVDNNVLLSWNKSQGTLSIDHYIVDEGGVDIGIVYAEFSVVFESVAGTFTYGIRGVDSAGNVGPRGIISASVNQPPDFVLYSDIDSAFGGTKTNTWLSPDGKLYCNVDTSETWATHFSLRGWSSIDDQIAAGYPNYIVGKTTGSYVETVNYGVVVPATKITMTPTVDAVGATPTTITPQIETSPNNVTFTSFPGVYSAFGTSFQYVRFTMAFTAAHSGSGLADDTNALIVIDPLNYRLDIKQRRFEGSLNALSTDAGGTLVNITGMFIDVTSITVSALGTTPLYVVYDFVDVPNPTSFKVLVFNSSGTRVSATVSYTISGV